jgi:spermidine/putrescine-binding protein
MTTTAATSTAAPSTASGAAKPTLRYNGSSFLVPEDAIKKWKELTGQDVEATYPDVMVIPQKQMSDPTAWDFGGSMNHRQMVTAGILAKIPLEKIPRWQIDKLAHIFAAPEDTFLSKYPDQPERFNYCLWADNGQSRTDLISVPAMWNFDSVIYLPEFVPFEEHGGAQTTMAYTEMFKPEWKGKVGLQDDFTLTFPECGNMLAASGQMTIESCPMNMSTTEVDQVFNYLLPIVKSGQIRTFWGNYGDIVNLCSTKELYMASVWQPVVFDTRKAGTPAYYARMVHGPLFWYNSDYLSTGGNPDTVDDCIKFLNWTLEQWIELLYTRQGYPSPAEGWDDYKTGMGAEFYDWFFNGKATYLPIDDVMKEIWPDHQDFWTLPERMQNALFTPDVYFRQFWTGEPPRTGSPDPHGNLRDMGSDRDKEQITRYLQAPDVPDNAKYYSDKFEELKANLPK